MRAKLLLPLLLTIAACSNADDGRTAGGVSEDEAKALDEAAQMIEAQRPPALPAASAQPAATPAVQPAAKASPAASPKPAG